MSKTIVKGKEREVIISPEAPFCVIGERINPTGNKRLREGLERGDLGILREEAERQIRAGAQIIDVNVGVSGLDEPSLLRDAIQLIQGFSDVPLSIDSANVKALEVGLEVYEGRCLINSVNGEDWKLKEVLALSKDYGASVIGLTMDEKGIPAEPEGRLLIAEKILEEATKIGIRKEDVIIDPIAMSLASDHRSAIVTLKTIESIRSRFDVNIIVGASNISYGLPERPLINSIFLGVAIYAGLTCALLDPTRSEIQKAISIGNMLMGKDEYCLEYINLYRSLNP